MENKKNAAIVPETLAWWLIAAAIFVLLMIGYIVATGKGTGAIEYIKSLFRFRS